uniref:cell division protein ZapA n=1 Tax=Agathobacter sp. TaxID=2021311 RepID=UPI004055EBAA
MSAKTTAEVVIGGKVYTLSGYEGEEYLQKVAAYINSKINEFDQLEGTRYLAPNIKNALLQINIADDYFKAKAQIEKLEREAAQKDKEIYDLKHDLISGQIKIEDAEERIHELEAENKELLLNKTRLETTLEETLLDSDESKKKQ